jgi:microcystin degradation protein MlrC
VTKRLAVARFWFEGNAFSPAPTTLDSFRHREWVAGPAALAAARDTETELGGVVEFATVRTDWHVTVLRCASANPAGPIEELVFEAILAEIVDGLSQARWDGVYLSLHGAAITTERAAPDLDLVRAVRTAVGNVPLVASFDLHGNMNAELVTLLDFASAYRTYPHVDMRETASRVLTQLDAIVSGHSRPRGALVKTGILLPSFNMRTSAGPMAEIMAEAAAATTSPVLDVSVFGGFPYADTRECGATVMAYAEEHEWAARNAAVRTAEAILGRRNAFRVSIPGPNQALREAVKCQGGLVAVTEPADNPLSGGCADTPGLFRALLDLHMRPDGQVVFAFFADAESVERCIAAGIGSSLDLELGARTSRDFGAKVPVQARVLRATDGRFRNRGPMEFGMQVDLGRTVVIKVAGIDVILTSRCQPANDPAFFDIHGIDLTSTRLLCVKAKNHFRAAFESICDRIIDCDSPGPAAADLANLPFRNIRPH